MEKSVEQLILALEKEYEIYEEFLELAKTKRKIIIEGQVKELDGITKQEQSMILALGKLENIREAVVLNLVKELGVEDVQKIEELAKYLDKDSRKKVADVKNKLTDILNIIRKENDLNSKLIKQSLDFIDFNKNLISSMESKGATYGSNANEKDVKTKTNLFDARV